MTNRNFKMTPYKLRRSYINFLRENLFKKFLEPEDRALSINILRGIEREMMSHYVPKEDEDLEELVKELKDVEIRRIKVEEIGNEVETLKEMWLCQHPNGKDYI